MPLILFDDAMPAISLRHHFERAILFSDICRYFYVYPLLMIYDAAAALRRHPGPG